MMDVTQKLQEIMLDYEGICAIFVTDVDGGLIINVGACDNQRFRYTLILSHMSAFAQIHKLTMGGHKSTYASYETHQIAVHSVNGYYFFIHAGTNASAGTLLAMRQKFVPIGQYLLKVCPPIVEQEVQDVPMSAVTSGF